MAPAVRRTGVSSSSPVWLAIRLRTVVCAVLGASVACAATLRVPGQGGPPWLELSSEHFTLWTDTQPERAQELIRDMEQFRRAAMSTMFSDASSTDRTIVIALRDDDELNATLSTKNWQSYHAIAAAPLWQPVIVLSAHSDGGEDRSVAFQVARLVSSLTVHQRQRWLLYGIVRFLATMQLDVDNAAVLLGIAPRDGANPLRIARLAPVAMLFAWRDRQERDVELGATSWALFTFLANEHGAELVRYLRLVASMNDVADAALPQRLARAWTEAFPTLAMNTLDTTLRQWLVHGKHEVIRYAVPRDEIGVATRTLADADVHAALAWLYGLADDKRRQRASLAAALDADPTNVLANTISHQLGDRRLTVSAARAITSAHGDDWRAWWLASTAISTARGTRADADAAASKACTLIAQNPALVAPPKLCPPQVVSGPFPR